MDRRYYLTRSASVLGVVSLAGCLGSLEFGDRNGTRDDRSDDSTSDESSDSDREADREIRRAVGQLNKAGLALHAVEERLEDPETIEFDADEPRTRLETARDHLETAEEDATDARLADVEELRAFADVLERLVDVTVAITEIEFAVDDVQTAIDERRFDEARDSLRTRQETVVDARDRLDPVHETIETLDGERLESLDVVDLEPIADGASALDRLLDALATLFEAYDAIVTGNERLVSGQADADDREYETARGEFEAARDAFADATETLASGGDVPSSLANQIETARCRSQTLEEAAVRLVDSADAALDGDVSSARDLEDEATSLIDDADACGD
ncbi:hypothetical protein ACFOZ7_08180 [Natribaculum luteum]|uniref:Halo transducer protein n=1 Tax=Natribaculum luteum TaxID=1586232 RepID=A0ABD5NZ01_9EURY|nr:hypothetical protein [Natribaculum luteum]